MKNNNLQTIDEQDDYIYSLDIAQLCEVERNGEFLFQNDVSLQTDKNFEALKYDNTDAYIQNLQLKELKELEVVNEIQSGSPKNRRGL